MKILGLSKAVADTWGQRERWWLVQMSTRKRREDSAVLALVARD